MLALYKLAMFCFSLNIQRCGNCGVPKVELDNFDNTWNDGKWHSVEFILGRDSARTTIGNITYFCFYQKVLLPT